MAKGTCTVDGCENDQQCKGLCKPCYRRDYYRRNRERELAGMAQWRKDNYEYDRQRWADYAEKRWGDDRRARAAATKERVGASEKACTKCGGTKPKSEFHRDPRRVDGLYSWCKSCFHQQVASIRTPESERERRARHYANPVNVEKQRARHRAWMKANPEKNRGYVNRRRALELAATVGEVDYGQVIERDGMWCYLCRKDIAALGDLHIDHVVPLSRGGEHSMANLKPTHGRCNQRKKDKLPEELDWYVAG